MLFKYVSGDVLIKFEYTDFMLDKQFWWCCAGRLEIIERG